MHRAATTHRCPGARRSELRDEMLQIANAQRNRALQLPCSLSSTRELTRGAGGTRPGLRRTARRGSRDSTNPITASGVERERRALTRLAAAGRAWAATQKDAHRTFLKDSLKQKRNQAQAAVRRPHQGRGVPLATTLYSRRRCARAPGPAQWQSDRARTTDMK